MLFEGEKTYKVISFNDVADTSGYVDAITFISAWGIISGTGNGNFSPEAKQTRGQFVVMMIGALSYIYVSAKTVYEKAYGLQLLNILS